MLAAVSRPRYSAWGRSSPNVRLLAVPPVAGVAWQVMLGIVPLLVPALWETPNWTMVTPLGWLAIAYVAIVPMTVAYLAWFRALRLVSAATASTALLIAPVAGVFSSALLLGEALGARQLMALALTLTGWHWQRASEARLISPHQPQEYANLRPRPTWR